MNSRQTPHRPYPDSDKSDRDLIKHFVTCVIRDPRYNDEAYCLNRMRELGRLQPRDIEDITRILERHPKDEEHANVFFLKGLVEEYWPVNYGHPADNDDDYNSIEYAAYYYRLAVDHNPGHHEALHNLARLTFKYGIETFNVLPRDYMEDMRSLGYAERAAYLIRIIRESDRTHPATIMLATIIEKQIALASEDDYGRGKCVNYTHQQIAAYLYQRVKLRFYMNEFQHPDALVRLAKLAKKNHKHIVDKPAYLEMRRSKPSELIAHYYRSALYTENVHIDAMYGFAVNILDGNITINMEDIRFIDNQLGHKSVAEQAAYFLRKILAKKRRHDALFELAILIMEGEIDAFKSDFLDDASFMMRSSEHRQAFRLCGEYLTYFPDNATAQIVHKKLGKQIADNPIKGHPHEYIITPSHGETSKESGTLSGLTSVSCFFSISNSSSNTSPPLAATNRSQNSRRKG